MIGTHPDIKEFFEDILGKSFDEAEQDFLSITPYPTYKGTKLLAKPLAIILLNIFPTNKIFFNEVG